MALALAWSFEATAEGMRRTTPADEGELEAILAIPRKRRWAAGIAALLGVLLLAAGIGWTLRTGRSPANGYDSIAVLPFANLSGDVENEYFGDGLAEELLNALAGIDGLKVAARTSAFAFKDANTDVRRIGDTLGVATVLEGSVRRSRDRIRITAQLIDAASGYHIWSDTYDRPLTDLFTVQDAIAREIVNALAPRFTTAGDDLYRGGTADVAAYELYLLGRQKWVTRDVPLLLEAIGHFDAAIARDSAFALAWSGLADAIDALAWRRAEHLDLLPRARYAAQRALLLDPELAEAWASVGVLAADFDRDFAVAELALRQAIALRPSNAVAHHWLADVLRFSGRVEESLSFSTRALELDPVSGIAMNGQLQSLAMLERWAEARVIADRMIGVDYTELGSLTNVISAAPQLGFTADETASFAVQWARVRGYSRPEEGAVIGRAIIEPALRPRAREVIGRMTVEGISAPNLAELSMAIDDAEGALAILERGLAAHDPNMIVVGTDWVYDPVRGDPRYIRIIDALGLPNGR
jgi:TolB-like protein